MLLRISDLLVLGAGAALALSLRVDPPAGALALAFVPLVLLAAVSFRAARAARGRPAVPAWPRNLAAGVPDQPRLFTEALLWTVLSWGLKRAGLAMLFTALGGPGFAVGMLAAIAGDLSLVLPLHARAVQFGERFTLTD